MDCIKEGWTGVVLCLMRRKNILSDWCQNCARVQLHNHEIAAQSRGCFVVLLSFIY